MDKRHITVAAMAALALATRAYGQQRASNWAGTTNGTDVLWSDPLNWEHSTPISDPSELVIFGQTDANVLTGPLSSNSDLDVSLTIGQLRFFNSPDHIRKAIGGDLTLVGAISLISAFTTTIDPDLTVSQNNQEWVLNDASSLVVNKVALDGVNLTISAETLFGNNRPPSLVFADAVSGSGAIHIIGSASLVADVQFAAPSSFTGGVFIDRGNVAAQADNALGTGPVALGNSASAGGVTFSVSPNITLPNVINVNGQGTLSISLSLGSATTSSTTLTGAINLSSATSTFVIGSAGGSNVLNITGGIHSSQTFNDPDLFITGNVTLSGSDSTYHGATNVSQGTLEVDSTLSAAGGARPLLINTGATLAGTGTINDRTVNIDGRLDPGAQIPGVQAPGTIGTLTFGSALNLGGIFHVDLPGDQIVANGDVTLSGNLEIGNGSALAVGQSFTLIDNRSADPVSGAFANFPANSLFPFGDHFLSLSYTAGDRQRCRALGHQPLAGSLSA
jgi:autotransporter-associated beta strand protein